MTLSELAADSKKKIYKNLLSDRVPSNGKYDEFLLDQLRSKGQPQMGSTVFEPKIVHTEFIYMSEGMAVGVLRVELDPPERIVFMPVPKWVTDDV